MTKSHPTKEGGSPASKGPEEILDLLLCSELWASSPPSPTPSLSPPSSPRCPHLLPRPVPVSQRWDEELAAFAKAYARECVWGHNKERGRRGENLFAITDEGMDVPLAVEEWYLEREHYNLSTATCEPGQMCGHYTQVRGPAGRRVGGAA